MDTCISEAQEAQRQIRNTPHNLPPEEWTQQKRRKRHQLLAARQHKAQTLQQWEENWLTQQAHLADQASARHDMGTVFRIVKDLANVEDTQRRFGCRTEHHPEEIAEEWKQHFQAIQLGKIIVPEEFWQDILPLDTDAT